MKENAINELNNLNSLEVESKNRTPLKGIIELTNVCNFKCVHCYIINAKKQKPTFLSYDIIKSAIDEISEMGCKKIVLTGGECMLHPDFERIYTYIWNKGIKVNIFTNASLITDKTIILLKKYIPECVEVSLYGASEYTYKEVTKSTNYADVIKGLKLLQNSGIKLRFKIIVLKQNEHELEEMKRLACKYTNSPIRISNYLMPSYDFSLDVLNNHSHIMSSTNLKNNHRTNKQAFNCSAGHSFFCINFKGNATLCLFCSFLEMSLKKHSFHEIWKTFGNSIDLPISKNSKCYNCIFLNECRNCPAKTWMFNQKIGLYPIPQCKYNNYDKIEGANVMKNSKKILPETFVNVNGINYFRLENGKIAVENIKNITIDVNNEESVELITLKCKEKEVKFWKVNDDKIYALASSSYITIPENITFNDFYFSPNYPDGVYVKYTSSGKCGILYVSETEVDIVISHEKNYIEIDFENGLFYANTENGEKKYHIIGESGKNLGTYPSKCKRLKGYMLFYDENKIFIDSIEFEIPGGIISVEVVNNNEITFVKVVNNKGIYYYTKNISYLLGPIQKEEIISIDERSCYIHEIANGKIIKVFYIRIKEDTYICKSLSCDKGINIFQIKDENIKQSFFATIDKESDSFKELYTLKKDFILLIKDVNADKFIFNESEQWNKKYDVVAFVKNRPIYWASYDMAKNEITDSCILEVIDSDFEEETNICKSENEIFVINGKGKIIFSTTGEKCYKRKTCFKNSWQKTSIYIVEKGNNEIELYESSGKKI